MVRWEAVALVAGRQPGYHPPLSILPPGKEPPVDPILVDGELVEIVGARQARVKSRSEEGLWYAVDLEEERCTCKGWQVRKECRHLTAVQRFVEGTAEVPTVEQVRKVPLFTGRYAAWDSIAEAIANGIVPVRVTLGHPRFALKYELAGTIMELAPKGMKDVPDDDEFTRLYRARLESFGVDRLRRRFADVAGDAKGLVLCCYEDLTKPGEFCHRRVFAEWWEEQTGEKVEELSGLPEATLL